MKNRNQTSSSGSKRKKRGDHKKEEEDSSHTSTERLSLETAKEILQQLEEDVMDVIDESQKKFISNHKNDPAEQRFLDDYFSDLNTWLEDDRTEMHNTLLERFGRPKPNNYLLDAPHHYRTRSTTGTGIGTSSAKMEAKQIANNDLDAFNNIPSSIIEHILCLVPIKDAVRTSILSRNWRYRWTKIPKLEFDLEGMVDENQVEEQLFADWSSERKELMRRCKQFFAVHQVLFMHQAPVLDFTFSAMEPDDDICVEIEQLITQLARRTNNTVKKFTFKITNKSYDDYSHYELPRSIFLLRNLTDLHIEGCTLGQFVPTLDGFGSLTSLYFSSGCFSEKPLLHLLANCPLLKKLELEFHFSDISINERQYINIIELFKCLPVIEDLSISRWIIRDSVVHDVPRELPIALVHLKRFHFSSMRLRDGYGLEFVFLVIISSPNLEKIELHIMNDADLDHMMYEVRYSSDALNDCDDIWLEHLKELEIRRFANLEHEVKFVKLILERAPMLKKVRIFLDHFFNSIKRDRDLKTIRNVLGSSPRVSPLAEIIVLP